MFACLNAASLIILGLVLQIGGAYIVNAVILSLGDAPAAVEYSDYMAAMYELEPRAVTHAIFVAPLVEEIVFRLIFLRAGCMVLPFWAANIIQAVLFGIYHSTSFQRVYAVIMGLIIGCVFHYCPIIYRNHAAGYGYVPRSGANEADRSSPRGFAIVDLPNSLMGVGITFMLHVVINVAGLFIVPCFPADIAVPAQYAIGTVLMMAAGAACYVLYRQSKKTLPPKQDGIIL